MRLIEHLWSAIAAWRASATLGRGFRLRDHGDMQGALDQARIGLAILSKPYINRTSPTEASAIVSLTLLAEEAAAQMSVLGASAKDLSDSVTYLKQIDHEPRPELCSAIPFLEARLAAAHIALEDTEAIFEREASR